VAAERERLLTQAERDKLERQLHQSQRLEPGSRTRLPWVPGVVSRL